MSDTLTDYTELYLANAYTDGDLTLDVYAKNASYKLTDQKTSSLITELYLAAIDRDDDTKFMGFKISNVVENGLWQTKTRYTLTIATSDGSNPMAGLANTYDGTTADANIIAANQLDSLPADSLILCSIGSGVLRKLSTEFASGTTSETISLGSGEAFAIRSQLSLHTDGKYYKYHKTNYPNWKGTAGSAATGSGESFTLLRPGYRVPGYSGLTIGAPQYAENTGATTEAASATTQYIGKAFSATEIDLEASSPEISAASQAQAEAGTVQGVYMDPLRSKQQHDALLDDAETLTNKKLKTATIADTTDDTKEISFDASGIATSTERVVTMPDEDVDLADVNSAVQPAVATLTKIVSASIPDGAYNTVEFAHGLARTPKAIIFLQKTNTAGGITAIYPLAWASGILVNDGWWSHYSTAYVTVTAVTVDETNVILTGSNDFGSSQPMKMLVIA